MANQLKNCKHTELYTIDTIKEAIEALELVEGILFEEYGVNAHLQIRINSAGCVTLFNNSATTPIISRLFPRKFSLNDLIQDAKESYGSEVRDGLQTKIIKSFTQKTIEELEEIWAVAKIELIIQEK